MVMNNVASTADLPNPVLYLDALDYSGSGTTWTAETGSDATLINAPIYTAASPTYFTFDGVNEAASTANLKANFASSNSQTLEIWVRTASDNGVVISQTGTSAIDSFYHLSVMEIVSGDIKMGIWNGTGIGNVTVGTVTRNEWQQYVLTYDDATNTLTGYINAGSPASTTFENDPPAPGWFYHLCATDGTNMGDGSYLAAEVGLFRVWNTALTADQVQEIYNENVDRFSLTPTVTAFTTVETTSWTAPAGVSRVQYLVVGGGGGGGNGYDSGGGGGAGGGMVLTDYLDVIPGTTYTVTVGAGGTGGDNIRSNRNGTAGNDSVFATVTALGGGLGYGSRSAPGGIRIGGAAQVGSTTSGLGGNGGGGGGAGGGGGGATGAGGNGTGSTPAGTGGAGLASSITGSAVTYGGGGNGGTANAGVITGATGAANTGKGGGAGSANGSTSAAGGNGGSGIVVVKYGL